MVTLSPKININHACCTLKKFIGMVDVTTDRYQIFVLTIHSDDQVEFSQEQPYRLNECLG